MPHKRLELLSFSAPDPKSGVSTNSTNGAMAVREGVEPSCCDLIKDTYAAACGQPISFIYFVSSAHETSGCVCQCVHKFHHLTMCGESRIRTHGTVTRSSDFKSDAIDQLCHLSLLIRKHYFLYQFFSLLLLLLCTLSPMSKIYQQVPMPNTS